MGIKNLNRFLLDHCSKKSIKKTHLKQFSNKTLVIDTSIYLYKFVCDETLLESMYLFISILKHYNIKPIFVFDGKPPPEKKQLLIQRRIEKIEAEQKYNEIQKNMETMEDKEQAIHEMEYLRKQFIRIKEDDILKVKELMNYYGVTYYDANGEADLLCIQLVKTGIAWGCISDDMDMFLYGCAKVIRHISLLNHTAIFYDTENILNDLNMTQETFCDIMVLSGTDYNINSETNLYDTMKWYSKYTDSMKLIDEKIGFYPWLFENTKYILDYESLMKVRNLFSIESNPENSAIHESTINLQNLQTLMETEGFVFVHHE